LRDDPKSTELIKRAVDKLAGRAPTLDTMISDQAVDAPTVMKLFLSGEIYMQLINMGYPEVAVNRVLEHATLEVHVMTS